MTIVHVVTVVLFGGGGLAMLFVGLRDFFRQRHLLAHAESVEAETWARRSARGSLRRRRTRRFRSATPARARTVFIVLGLILPPLSWFVGRLI